jgi:hypothetical protein
VIALIGLAMVRSANEANFITAASGGESEGRFRTLRRFQVGSNDSLSVASVRFNPTNAAPSKWVDRLFLSRAAYRNSPAEEENKNNENNKGQEDQTDPNPTRQVDKFRATFEMPANAVWSKCSYELLAFVRRRPSYLTTGHWVGEANVTFHGASSSPSTPARKRQWRCFYRLLENTYWPAHGLVASFVYCPVRDDADERTVESACGVREQLDARGDLSGRISMDLPAVSALATTKDKVLTLRAGQVVPLVRLSADFVANPPRGTLEELLEHLDSGGEGDDQVTGPKNQKVDAKGFKTFTERAPLLPLSSSFAACLVVPYASSLEDKSQVNKALIYEWVRHYSLLGFLVMVYDRDGLHERAIFHSRYGRSQGDEGQLRNIVYYPYTVLGLFDGSTKGIRYDSAEQGGMYRMKVTDADKIATLTHARFEASALLGIENVLVADFDEFLYAPHAKATLQAQQHAIKSMLTHLSNKGMDQLTVRQVTPAYRNHTERRDAVGDGDGEGRKGAKGGVADCILAKVDYEKSVFECFGDASFVAYSQFTPKSIHLGHKCPLTNYHSSCRMKALDNEQIYDCVCYTIDAGSAKIGELPHLVFLHLSTLQSYYQSMGTFTAEQLAAVDASKLQLMNISHKRSPGAAVMKPFLINRHDQTAYDDTTAAAAGGSVLSFLWGLLATAYSRLSLSTTTTITAPGSTGDANTGGGGSNRDRDRGGYLHGDGNSQYHSYIAQYFTGRADVDAGWVNASAVIMFITSIALLGLVMMYRRSRVRVSRAKSERS